MGMAGSKAADCPPLGNLQFVWGQAGPEGLEVVAMKRWLVSARTWVA